MYRRLVDERFGSWNVKEVLLIYLWKNTKYYEVRLV